MVFKIIHLRKTKHCSGFTLMELMVVVLLLGLLATAGFSSYLSSQRNARDAKRKTDLETIRQALELYRSDNSIIGYPDVVAGSTEGGLKTALTTYISSSNFPKDPKSGQYYYYYRTAAQTYRLCALLEAKKTGDADCSGTYACSSTPTNCNYGVIQP